MIACKPSFKLPLISFIKKACCPWTTFDSLGFRSDRKSTRSKSLKMSQPLSSEQEAITKKRNSDVAVDEISKLSDSNPVQLRVKKLSENAVIPTRGSEKAAGYDLSSAYDYVLKSHSKEFIKTDLSIAIPEDTYARIAPRSGLAAKHSIDVLAGVVDYDYRGPVNVILFNHSDKDFEIKSGDRIAQLILERILTPEVVEVEELDETDRGSSGFGSTGVSVKNT